MAGKGRAHNSRSGRQKGTPNKRSLEAAAMLEAAGFDPDLPWLYWARVLKSHLAPLPKGNKADKAEQFYQGRELVNDGKDAGSHYEPVYARATADMAEKAAKGLAPYIRPQLMRIQGTGTGGALVIQFEEDPRMQGKPKAAARAQEPGAAAMHVAVEAQARGKRPRVRPIG